MYVCVCVGGGGPGNVAFIATNYGLAVSYVSCTMDSGSLFPG